MQQPMVDPNRCFRCGRFLGPLLEWRKMMTDQGPLCFTCYNEAAARERDGGKGEER